MDTETGTFKTKSKRFYSPGIIDKMREQQPTQKLQQSEDEDIASPSLVDLTHSLTELDKER